MIRYLGTVLMTLYLSCSFAQTYNESYGEPKVVLIETDPWLMVIGSDVPTFALYENGQVIYRKVVDDEYQYFEIKYDRTQTQSVISSFGITDSLMLQSEVIEASLATDQPSNILLLNFDTLAQLEVYGNLRNLKGEARKRTPKDFLKVYDNILKFEDAAAVTWLPDSIEVMATNYDYSPEEPLKWNEAWNDLNSSSTIKHSSGLYSIFLDRKDFDEVVKLIENLKEKQGVEINGKKYSLNYRLPFPNL
ncbi:hypothetical protein [Sphingobacterium chungjuense]|uniref:hypothetical protein n=1 Tax=Sphingobacterium chungjuense TaxID=2675553 RepID=UPI00140A1035|nr:hypothetical protein [Sphingobacterium chungjuense]